LEKIGDTKFSNFDSKKVFYSGIACAEHESGVEKILKIFVGQLESQNHFIRDQFLQLLTAI